MPLVKIKSELCNYIRNIVNVSFFKDLTQGSSSFHRKSVVYGMFPKIKKPNSALCNYSDFVQQFFSINI